jgi:predicted nucleic acid-binding Zn ribbon protein
MVVRAEQTHCDRCRAELQPGAAYCDRCGQRTRKAQGTVRLAIRVELLLIGLMVVLIFGFAFVFLKQ